MCIRDSVWSGLYLFGVLPTTPASVVMCVLLSLLFMGVAWYKKQTVMHVFLMGCIGYSVLSLMALGLVSWVGHIALGIYWLLFYDKKGEPVKHAYALLLLYLLMAVSDPPFLLSQRVPFVLLIVANTAKHTQHLSLIHISEPTRPY